MLPQPSTHSAINHPPRRWSKRHRRLTSRCRSVLTSSLRRSKLTYPGTANASYNYDLNGNQTTTYLHGPNIDEPLGMERNGQNYSFHADGLGSIIAITDATGQKVQSYSYDSFGNPTQTTAFRNSYLFTGREYDEETGLYYYRARYYDLMLGKFISKDPISFKGGDTNLYRYVQNNPINFIDPFGLTPGRSKVQPPIIPSTPQPSPSNESVNGPTPPSGKQCCTRPVFHQNVYWNCVYNNVANDHIDDYLFGGLLIGGGLASSNPIGWGAAIAGGVGVVALSNSIGQACHQAATYCD